MLSGAAMSDLKARIREEAARLGFAECGFTRADLPPETVVELSEWMAEGRHGTMTWMEERAAHRSSPTALWSDARSAIVLAMSYAPATDPLALAGDPGAGRISVYARGGDYHKTVKKGLKALARWLIAEAGGELKVFVDTAPVMEKPLAQAAGIGWQGKHTNLVSRKEGSWLFLGVILTTLELEPDPPASSGQHCGSCSRCLESCPDRSVRRPPPDRCAQVHFLPHHRASRADPGAVSRSDRQPHLWLRRLPGRLPVEPLRRHGPGATAPSFPREDLQAPRLADLLALDDAAFRARFAGSPIKRIGVARMIRNCLIAAGNSGDPGLLASVEPHLQSADPVIAEAAGWAHDRLSTAES